MGSTVNHIVHQPNQQSQSSSTTTSSTSLSTVTTVNDNQNEVNRSNEQQPQLMSNHVNHVECNNNNGINPGFISESNMTTNVTTPPTSHNDQPQGTILRQPLIGSNTRRTLKGLWPNGLSPFFASLLCCANFYTICRFSILTYFLKGPFLIEFTFISIIFGLPFLLFLMVLGQYLGSGYLDMWFISPIFKGIGVAFLFCYTIISIYSVIPISWLLVYLRDSFLTTRDSAYKWTYCNRRFNGERCFKAWNSSTYANDYLGWSVSGYYHNTVLGQQDNGRFSAYAKLNIILNLALIWILIFVLLFRGIHHSSRMIIFFGTFPFIMFTFTIIRFVEEFGAGISSLFVLTDSSKAFLGDSTSWYLAARESFIVWILFGSIIQTIYASSRPGVSLIKHCSVLFLVTITLLVSSSFFLASCMHIITSSKLEYTFSSFEKYGTVNFVRDSPGTTYRPSVTLESGVNLFLGENLFSSESKTYLSQYQVLRWATEIMPLALALKGSRVISSFWATSFYLSGILISFGSHLVLWGTLIEAIISISPDSLRQSKTTIAFITSLIGFSVSVAINSWINDHIIYFLDSCFASICWIACLYMLMVSVIFVVRGKPCTPHDLVSNLTKDQKIISWLTPILTFHWSLVVTAILTILSILFTRSYLGFELSWFNISFMYPFWSFKVAIVWNILQLAPLYIAVERTNGAGLEERDTKIIIEQISSALEFLHDKQLVHRDVRAENILIFSVDFTKVKLTDFGLTRRAETLVKKRTRSLPTCPPEIWEAVHLEGYNVELGSDVWQLAMLIFACLTTKFPWERADITDPRFSEFVDWQKRVTTRTPREFRRFTPRLLRCFKRMMEIKPSKRYPVVEVRKYYKDRWLLQRSPRASSIAKLNPSHDRGDHHAFNSGAGVSRSLSCSQLMPSQSRAQEWISQSKDDCHETERRYLLPNP